MSSKPYEGPATVVTSDGELECTAKLVATSEPSQTARSFRGLSAVTNLNAQSGYSDWRGILKFDNEQEAFDLYKREDELKLRIDWESGFSATALLADATVQVVGGSGDIPFE